MSIFAGIAQLVEHNLAKVGVESSSLFSRSISIVRHVAGWQSGYAAACKAVDAGSIPTPASTKMMVSSRTQIYILPRWRNR